MNANGKRAWNDDDMTRGNDVKVDGNEPDQKKLNFDQNIARSSRKGGARSS